MAVAKTFMCGGCGNPLQIPKNSRGHVKCPDCGNDCVLEGLIQNAEIAQKENINCGIPLSASPQILHSTLVWYLSKTHSYMPLDLFDKVEVVREEHYCIPGYIFECEADEQYSCQIGIEKQQAYGVGDTEKIRYHTEWNPYNSRVSLTESVFVSGNKEFTEQVNALVRNQSKKRHSELMDIEELEIPAFDVKTYSFNLPETAAFNEHVKPYIEELLKEKAQKSLGSQTYRNLSMDGSKISKTMKRAFFNMYRLVYKFDDTEYYLWCSSDGNYYLPCEMPADEGRLNKHQELQAILAAVPTNEAPFLIVATVILALLAFTGPVVKIFELLFG